MADKPTYEELEKKILELEKAESRYRQTEKKMADQINFSQTLLQAAPVFYVAIDSDGNTLMINDTMLDSLGYNRDEVIGGNYMALFVPEESHKELETIFKQLIANNKPTLNENFVLARDGRQILVEWHGRSVFNDNGDFQYFFGVGIDITKRKVAQDALQASHERFLTVLNSLDATIYVADMETYEILFVNQYMIKSFGRDMTGEICWSVFRNEKSPCSHCTNNRLLDDSGNPTGVCIWQDKNPITGVWYINYDRAIQWTDGRMVKLQIATDITERKRTEEKLRESEERYRAYFEEDISGAYISSPDGKLIACNNEYVRIFGFKNRQQALDTPIQSLSAVPGARDEFLNLIEQGKQVTGYEPKVKKIDGTPLHLIENATGVFDKENNLKHIRGFLMDVTERKRLELQLQQAQKMEAIGTLAGGIAHDFNNILFPILGHTEILMHDIPDKTPAHDRLKKIYAAGIRAKDLVKQILTFSRQDSFRLNPMQLQPIIKEVLKFIRSTIPTTIEIRQDISPDCGRVNADPTQIHQIVMNLATNAYHAMDEMGGILNVGLKQVESDMIDAITPDMKKGSYACLTISDTGVGMDAQVVNKIFDPFFTTKEKGKGTGMGLAVVHGIVANMNGTIQATSEPGSGTRFNVYFPLERQAVKKKTIHTDSFRGGTETLLVVDDEEEIVAMIKEMLEELGYTVVVTTSSSSALDIFKKTPDKFDLVLTDMAMPGMSGDRLAAELTRIRPTLPILLSTGFCPPPSEEKIQALGISGILSKPLTQKDIAQKIRQVLGDAPANPQ